MFIYLAKKVIGLFLIILFIPIMFALFPAILLFIKWRQYEIIRIRNKRLVNGINILEPIEIGGVQQWISIRGQKKENPLLLILHGGPFFSMMPFSYIFDSLEAHFTIVQWDQRGTGKTARASRKSSATLTLEQVQADALELVKYLRQRFNKEKIFLLGHSWGSAIGLTLAHEQPEWVYAYIGTGQVVNQRNNEKYGYDKTLKTAYENNNVNAINDLDRLVSFKKNSLTELGMDDLQVLRKWQFQFNPISINKSSWISILVNFLAAPEYSFFDYLYLIRGILFLLRSKEIFAEMMSIDLDDKTIFSTAIYIFGGRNDAVTASLPVYDYFKKIQAPRKEYIWFENSGHNLFFEETEKFISCLRQCIG